MNEIGRGIVRAIDNDYLGGLSPSGSFQRSETFNDGTLGLNSRDDHRDGRLGGLAGE